MRYYKSNFEGTPSFSIYATDKSMGENRAIAIYYDDYWGCDPHLAKFVEYPEESWFEGIAAAEFYRIDAYLIDPSVPWSPDNDSEIRRIWWEPDDVEEILNFCIE